MSSPSKYEVGKRNIQFQQKVTSIDTKTFFSGMMITLVSLLGRGVTNIYEFDSSRIKFSSTRRMDVDKGHTPKDSRNKVI